MTESMSQKPISELVVILKNNFQAMFCFLSVGAVTAILYFLVFTLFWKFLGINYKTAVTIGYIMGVTFQFLSNRHFTFKNKESPITNQFIKYLILVGINYIITYLVVDFVVEKVKLSPYVGIIASIIITVGIGFVLSKFWVFRSTALSE